MSDEFSSDSKRKEIEDLFSKVGFSFDHFDPKRFEEACSKLSNDKGMEFHTRTELNATRAKMTTPEDKRYQILFDGELHVS